MNDSGPRSRPILGNWHVVDCDANESDLPQHRVDLVIRQSEAGFTGAVLSRRDGTDFAVLGVQFDGNTLRLQMHDPRQPERVDLPWLVMTPTNGNFEGRWHDAADKPMGPMLKLVRGRS